MLHKCNKIACTKRTVFWIRNKILILTFEFVLQKTYGFYPAYQSASTFETKVQIPFKIQIHPERILLHTLQINDKYTAQ